MCTEYCVCMCTHKSTSVFTCYMAYPLNWIWVIWYTQNRQPTMLPTVQIVAWELFVEVEANYFYSLSCLKRRRNVLIRRGIYWLVMLFALTLTKKMITLFFRFIPFFLYPCFRSQICQSKIIMSVVSTWSLVSTTFSFFCQFSWFFDQIYLALWLNESCILKYL